MCIIIVRMRSHSLLYYFIILTSLVFMNADGRAMKRREIGATLQQNDNNNRTEIAVTPLTHQNENITRLLPAPFVNGISKKTTLKLGNNSDVIVDNITDDDKHILLPSTTSAIPNTIDTMEEIIQDKLKLHMKQQDSTATKIPLISTKPETTIIQQSIKNNTEIYKHSLIEKFPSTSIEPLLSNKTQLSLEDSNEIQLSSSTSSSSPKQAKFLNDNSTNYNQLNLPNTADAWTLAGMKTTSPRLNETNGKEEQIVDTHSNKSNNLIPVKEKTLTDWTQIVKMGVDKSVENALTEQQQQQVNPLIVRTERITTMSAMIDKITAPATTIKPVTSFNPKQQNGLLSAIDNVDTMKSTSKPKNFLGEDPQNKEKHLSNEEYKELKSKTQPESTTMSFSPQERDTTETILTTTTMETPTTSTEAIQTTTMKMMTTISTPSTASVSAGSITTDDESLSENIIKSENISEYLKNSTLVSKIETRTINIEKQPLTTTRAVGPLETSTSPIFYSTTIGYPATTTNVTEVIDQPSPSPPPSPSPDVHQISAKSNLETPTTATIIATRGAETIETTTTPTLNIQKVNSSALSNKTLTQAESETYKNVTGSATESLLNTHSILSEKQDIYTTKESKKTVDNINETAVAKDTTSTSVSVSTTSLPVTSSLEKENYTQAISTTSTNGPVGETTTFATENSSKTVENSTEMSIPTVPTRKEITSTEAHLTNFIDDSTTTTTTTTTTRSAPTNSTISPTTPTPEVLSVETTTTTTNDLHSIQSETTPSITEETPLTVVEFTTENITTFTPTVTVTTTITTTTTLTELPTITPPQTTTIKTTTRTPTTTTESAIEMFPTITTQSTMHLESAPSTQTPTTTPTPKISTTLQPVNFRDFDMNILNGQPPLKSTPDNPETDVNVVIAISVSVIGVVALILLVAFLYLMRKRAKATSYGQRCRPVSLDAYSLDNVSVLGSVRRKSALRASKRSYGNAAFDDPSLRHNVQTAADLAKFVERRSSIFEEFRDVPQIIARPEEIPEGCENKNRYANVIPLPETRVILQRRNDDDTTEYINANYVRGPKDALNYYIACQAPLDSTVQDFWRMIWEQQSRVIIQATDVIENGIEKCAEYLPPSVTLDNHITFGDFQITLKNREVKDKYAISTIMLKNTISNTSREITHYWYKWPEIGVPSEEAPIIAMLLEARSSLKSYALEVTNELKEKFNSDLENDNSNGDKGEYGAKSILTATVNGAAGTNGGEINGNVSEKSKTLLRNQGPLTIHCSPGTGRTGTIIACDMAIRCLETTKSLDIPQIVYYIRRGRASAVQTKEQYEFIYKVANIYAMKITDHPNDN